MACFVQIAKMFDLLGRGIERVHLRGSVIRLGTEHVINLAVAGRRDTVIAIVRNREMRIVDLRDESVSSEESICRTAAGEDSSEIPAAKRAIIESARVPVPVHGTRRDVVLGEHVRFFPCREV